MKIEDFLFEMRAGLEKKWVKMLLSTYESPAFLNIHQNRFANPVGVTLASGLEAILKLLAKGEDLSGAAGPLEDIIKIRAVQEFTPTAAVSFVFGLKQIVREALVREKLDPAGMEGYFQFEERVDSLALMAFDLYMASRERLFRVRLHELTNGNYTLTDGAICPSALLRRERGKSAAEQSNLS